MELGDIIFKLIALFFVFSTIILIGLAVEKYNERR